MRIYLYKARRLEEIGPVVDKKKPKIQEELRIPPVSLAFGNLLWEPSLGPLLIWPGFFFFRSDEDYMGINHPLCESEPSFRLQLSLLSNKPTLMISMQIQVHRPKFVQPSNIEIISSMPGYHQTSSVLPSIILCAVVKIFDGGFFYMYYTIIRSIPRGAL